MARASEQPLERFNCYQCHDSGDMNCTARCPGSQEALLVYRAEQKEQAGINARLAEFEKRAETGEFENNEGVTDLSRAREFIALMRDVLRKKKSE